MRSIEEAEAAAGAVSAHIHSISTVAAMVLPIGISLTFAAYGTAMPFALALLATMLIFSMIIGYVYWSFGLKDEKRRARLRADGERRPPTGAHASFDETAFTLDSTSVAWASLNPTVLVIHETEIDGTNAT